MRRFSFALGLPDADLGRRERIVQAELGGKGWEVSCSDQAGRPYGRPRLVETAADMEATVRRIVDELLRAYFLEQTRKIR